MLLSSVAESMFWTGRYAERARALSRAVLAYERLSFDLPAARKLELSPLFALMGRSPDAESKADRRLALERLTLDEGNPSSVLGALLVARENLRVARVVAPVELWITLGALTHQLKAVRQASEAGILEALETTLALGSRFEGERQASMTHDAAHAFLELGCHLERADMQVRCLTSLTPALLPAGWERAYDDVRWSGLLHALGLHSAYRRHHHHKAELPRLLALAVSDTSCPSSVAHCLQAMQRHLGQLPHALPVSEQLAAALDSALSAAEPMATASWSLLSALAEQLASLGTAISSSYFPREAEVSAAPRVTEPSRSDPFEQLKREHAQIDGVLRVLEILATAAQDGLLVDRRELHTIVAFLTDCGELGHHEKEESILTPVLASHGFDWYGGPLANMRREHQQEHYFIQALTHLASQSEAWTRDDARRFAATARELCHFLHAHMGHEEHDLFEQASRALPAGAQAALCRAFEDLDARSGLLAAESRGALHALVEKYAGRSAARSAG